MRVYSILLTAILLGFVTFSQAQTINPNKSNAEFKVSNLGANKIKGTFRGMKGDMKFDPRDLSDAYFNVCIDANTVDSKNLKRDTQLKSAEYFDVANHPSICFQSTSVERSGMSYKTKGKLTMHGQTKVVEILFNYSRNLFTGKLKLNRLDYKIGPPSGILVGKQIEITIQCFLD